MVGATQVLTTPSHRSGVIPSRLPKTWAGLSAAAAALSVIASLTGLLAAARIYGEETPALADAATAQDLVGLVVLAPALLTLAVSAARGSLRSWLCLLGCLSFTAYNGAIYAFSIHFGPLFLVWVAVLGLSLFGLIGGLASLEPSTLRAAFAHSEVRLPGWFLIVVAALFSLLWLTEIMADLLAGQPSSSAADWNVPTNPVHVLDLAIFLPAVFVSGVLLLTRHRLGYATAIGQLVFVELTCLPALVTPWVAHVRGHVPGWSVILPLGTIAIATLVVLWRFLRMVDHHPAVEWKQSL